MVQTVANEQGALARHVFATHPLFGQLSAEERDRLVTFMRLARFAPRTVLFRKGDPGSNMMVVLRGRVQVCVHSEEGEELSPKIINPGEAFGAAALLCDADRTADAVTLDETELLVLEQRDFVSFLSKHPEACLQLVSLLCQRMQQEEALFPDEALLLAKRLVHLAETFGKPTAHGTRIDMRLSQQQLGNMVGMSRESMNKQLGQWRREGLIRLEDGYITIPDLEILRSFASDVTSSGVRKTSLREKTPNTAETMVLTSRGIEESINRLTSILEAVLSDSTYGAAPKQGRTDRSQSDESTLEEVPEQLEETLEQFERLTAKMLADTEGDLDEARRFNLEMTDMLASIERTMQETDRRWQLVPQD